MRIASAPVCYLSIDILCDTYRRMNTNLSNKNISTSYLCIVNEEHILAGRESCYKKWKSNKFRNGATAVMSTRYDSLNEKWARLYACNNSNEWNEITFLLRSSSALRTSLTYVWSCLFRSYDSARDASISHCRFLTSQVAAAKSSCIRRFSWIAFSLSYDAVCNCRWRFSTSSCIDLSCLSWSALWSTHILTLRQK